jgi:hypothetical protein
VAKDKASQEAPQSQNVSVSVNLDTTPILFTDNVIITANEDGVVLDVAQKLATSNQTRVVARIGMSRTHAKKFATELGRLLALTEGKSQKGGRE